MSSLLSRDSRRDAITQDMVHLASAVVLAAALRNQDYVRNGHLTAGQKGFSCLEPLAAFHAWYKQQLQHAYAAKSQTLTARGPSLFPNHETTPMTEKAKVSRSQTYDPILEPNCYQICLCKSESSL